MNLFLPSRWGDRKVTEYVYSSKKSILYLIEKQDLISADSDQTWTVLK